MRMDRSCSARRFLLRALVLFLSLRAHRALPSKRARALNNTVSALLVFGDSTADPGNNNYVRTVFKSDFPPYGRDFANRVPTGRFTNGRLASDYIVSYIGIKDYVPPYLDPSLSFEDLKTGVSFASAGSGYDPLTPNLSNVVSLPKQLEYFKEYKKRLVSTMGKQSMEHHVNKAAFLVSAGTNDFVVNYFTIPIRRRSFTVATYQQFLLQHMKDLIKGLWEEGARRMAVVGLPPMGCLPIMITLNSNGAVLQRGCMDQFSSVARDYNALLQTELASMQSSLASQGSRIYYADIYQPLSDVIQRFPSYGFDQALSGCCGTGMLEASFMCNPKSYVCPDASRYVFWDSIHPSEKTYYLLFQSLRPLVDAIIRD
ncbi:Lipase_GDSL domain-containing protein [Psidium guajava]|nr:Lipase_GDSL domain-containing protein [Psidium guajava]